MVDVAVGGEVFTEVSAEVAGAGAGAVAGAGAGAGAGSVGGETAGDEGGVVGAAVGGDFPGLSTIIAGATEVPEILGSLKGSAWAPSLNLTTMLTRRFWISMGSCGLRNCWSAHPLTEVIWPFLTPASSITRLAALALSVDNSQLV